VIKNIEDETLDLEQVIGSEIKWLTGETFDSLIRKEIWP
jgi:hypothetical protein